MVWKLVALQGWVLWSHYTTAILKGLNYFKLEIWKAAFSYFRSRAVMSNLWHVCQKWFATMWYDRIHWYLITTLLESRPHSCRIFRGCRAAGGMLLCGFWKLYKRAFMQPLVPLKIAWVRGVLLNGFQRPQKSLFQSCFKNKDHMQPGTVLGRL